MRGLRMAAASLAAWSAGPLAACGPDQAAGAWSDDFRAAGCLGSSRHIRRVPGGGLTLDTTEQVWALPGAEPFSAGRGDPAVAFERDRTGAERVTLRQWILRPGDELAVGQGCAPVGDDRCPADRKHRGTLTGRVHRDDRRTRAPEGFTGFPGFDAGVAPGAGWDTLEGAAAACAGAGSRAAYGGTGPVGAAPLLRSGPIAGLHPGVPYAVTVVAGASHDGDDVPALRAAMVDAKTGDEAPDALELREAELASPAVPERARMTAASFPFSPGRDGRWSLKVTAPAGAHAHCVLIGPAYVTAQRGVWASSVLDTFSDRTAWRDVEWELDQSSAADDPACACRTPGSPVTPVRVWWEAAPAAPAEPRFGAAAPLPDRGTEPIPATMAGRYFRFGLTLHGRGSAAEASPALASRDVRRSFAGWRPVVRKLKVRYRAAEARAESATILPDALGRWGRLAWAGDAPGGSTVAVDVLGEDGAELVRDAARELDLGGIADPYVHTALRLRVRLVSDPGDPAATPRLRNWGVRWERLAGRLILDRDVLRPGETVRGLAAVERAGKVRIRVRDGAGATLVRLVDDWRPARTLAFSWDGRDRDGQPAPAGVYHLTVTTAGGAGTRRIRVAR